MICTQHFLSIHHNLCFRGVVPYAKKHINCCLWIKNVVYKSFPIVYRQYFILDRVNYLNTSKMTILPFSVWIKYCIDKVCFFGLNELSEYHKLTILLFCLCDVNVIHMQLNYLATKKFSILTYSPNKNKIFTSQITPAGINRYECS